MIHEVYVTVLYLSIASHRIFFYVVVSSCSISCLNKKGEEINPLLNSIIFIVTVHDIMCGSIHELVMLGDLMSHARLKQKHNV